jgi:hypothetical protein
MKLPKELVEAVEKAVERPVGIQVRRTDAIRWVLYQGLESLKKKSK